MGEGVLKDVPALLREKTLRIALRFLSFFFFLSSLAPARASFSRSLSSLGRVRGSCGELSPRSRLGVRKIFFVLAGLSLKNESVAQDAVIRPADTVGAAVNYIVARTYSELSGAT